MHRAVKTLPIEWMKDDSRGHWLSTSLATCSAAADVTMIEVKLVSVMTMLNESWIEHTGGWFNGNVAYSQVTTDFYTGVSVRLQNQVLEKIAVGLQR